MYKNGCNRSQAKLLLQQSIKLFQTSSLSVLPRKYMGKCMHASHFQSLRLKSYLKTVLIRTVWYVLRVKKFHYRASSDSLGLKGEVNLSSLHYNIWHGKADLCKSKLALVFHHFPNVGSNQLFALAHSGCPC